MKLLPRARRSLLCIVHCALCIIASAQVGDPRRDVAVGVNVAYTMTQVSFQPEIATDMKNELGYGLTVRYNCEKYFSALCGIQAELNYVNFGWKERIDTSSDTYSRDLHYLQMPILARLAWGGEHKGAMFFIVAGPQVGLMLGKGKEHRGGEWSAATLATRPNNVTGQYGMAVDHRFDYGLTAGAGLEINTRRAGHYLLEGRYYLALGDIFSNSKRDYFGRSAYTSIYIKVSYLFDVLRTK